MRNEGNSCGESLARTHHNTFNVDIINFIFPDGIAPPRKTASRLMRGYYLFLCCIPLEMFYHFCPGRYKPSLPNDISLLNPQQRHKKGEEQRDKNPYYFRGAIYFFLFPEHGLPQHHVRPLQRFGRGWRRPLGLHGVDQIPPQKQDIQVGKAQEGARQPEVRTACKTTLYTNPKPDNFRSSQSGDRRILCGSETSCDWLKAPWILQIRVVQILLADLEA